jgi:hypothetical protein
VKMELELIPKSASGTLVQEAGEALSPEGVEVSLRKLGFLSVNESLLAYRDLSPWIRSGGETYLTSAEFRTQYCTQRFVCKAFVTFAVESEARTGQLLARRQLLAAKGVRVPKLFFAGKGLIFEQFIDHDIADEPRPLCERVLRQLGETASALDSLAFLPTNLLGDLRCEGGCVYYIDFGGDLGSPGQGSGADAWKSLSMWLAAEEAQVARSSYEGRSDKGG